MNHEAGWGNPGFPNAVDHYWREDSVTSICHRHLWNEYIFLKSDPGKRKLCKECKKLLS